MQKLSEIVGSALSKYNLWTASESLILIWRAKKHLSDFFWEGVLKFVDIKKATNWILTIKCKNASWAQEIQLINHDLIQLLEKDFWERKITLIRIEH
jgi:hypothetical protein